MGNWFSFSVPPVPPNKFTDKPYDEAVFRPFLESNFFKVYMECQHYKESSADDRLKLFHKSCQQVGVDPQMLQRHGTTGRAFTDADEQAIYLWTLNVVFGALNTALVTDDHQELQKFGYIMRAINRYLTRHPPLCKQVVFRGTKIRRAQIEQVQPEAGVEGKVFRQPWYVATSSSIDVAASPAFLRPGSPLMEFEVPKGCLNCCPIPAELSYYPHEQEWLMPPYTPVEYLSQSVRELGSLGRTLVVRFKVLDGMEMHHQEQKGLKIKSCLIMADLTALEGVECHLPPTIHRLDQLLAPVLAWPEPGKLAVYNRVEMLPEIWPAGGRQGWRCSHCRRDMGRSVPLYVRGGQAEFMSDDTLPCLCIACVVDEGHAEEEVLESASMTIGNCALCSTKNLLVPCLPCGHRVVCPACHLPESPWDCPQCGKAVTGFGVKVLDYE